MFRYNGKKVLMYDHKNCYNHISIHHLRPLSHLSGHLNIEIYLKLEDCLQVKTKLKGHQNRITGLAFSQTLNALVSSGADAQVNG